MPKITVSSCAYIHTEDVDPEARIKAGPVNDAMEIAVRRAVAALEEPANGYSDFHRNHIQTIFPSMLSTHRLIRKVLDAGYDNPEAIDALALARLPLESLYT